MSESAHEHLLDIKNSCINKHPFPHLPSNSETPGHQSLAKEGPLKRRVAEVVQEPSPHFSPDNRQGWRALVPRASRPLLPHPPEKMTRGWFKAGRVIASPSSNYRSWDEQVVSSDMRGLPWRTTNASLRESSLSSFLPPAWKEGVMPGCAGAMLSPRGNKPEDKSQHTMEWTERSVFPSGLVRLWEHPRTA